jgi:anti-anti-sigma factor
MEGRGDLIVDLAELTFMDSTGIHAILQATERLEPGGSVVLRSPRPEVMRVLEIAGLGDLPRVTIEP